MCLVIGVIIGFSMAMGCVFLNWYLEQKKNKDGTI